MRRASKKHASLEAALASAQAKVAALQAEKASLGASLSAVRAERNALNAAIRHAASHLSPFNSACSRDHLSSDAHQLLLQLPRGSAACPHHLWTVLTCTRSHACGCHACPPCRLQSVTVSDAMQLVRAARLWCRASTSEEGLIGTSHHSVSITALATARADSAQLREENTRLLDLLSTVSISSHTGTCSNQNRLMLRCG